MKIRWKITLWISFTILIAAIIFSTFVFLEMIEQPYYLIDAELKNMARILFDEYRNQSGPALVFNEKSLPNPPDNYWIKLTDSAGKTLYSSTLTQYTDIPLLQARRSYNIENTIPRERISIGQDAHDEVMFRVRVAKAQINDHDYTLVIAKPIEELEEEMLELFREFGAILATIFICGLLFSYKLAGRILQPIVTINKLVKEISEKSLDQRIPLNKSKDELYSLSVSLNQMFDRLRNSFIKQKDFIASASHELKSPISLLLLSQEEMLQKKSLPDSIRADLTSQHNSLQRMNRLIRNLLDLSSLEHQTGLDRSEVNIADLLDEVLEDYADFLSASSITVQSHYHGDLCIAGDREKLRRLLINLIDNAIRYNKQYGQVSVKGVREADRICLSVANTGFYIDDHDVKQLFEQFYRVEKSRSVKFGGSGLGLAIAKRIVELHEGNISFSSEKKGLNTVTVNLPIKHFSD